MPRTDKNVVMLWLMALALAVAIVISRHLMAQGLHPLHMALIQALGSFLSILAVRRGALPALPLLRQSARYFGWASLVGRDEATARASGGDTVSIHVPAWGTTAVGLTRCNLLRCRAVSANRVHVVLQGFIALPGHPGKSFNGKGLIPCADRADFS